MKNDEVIERLKDYTIELTTKWTNTEPTLITAITQAISLIKELNEYKERMDNVMEELVIALPTRGDVVSDDVLVREAISLIKENGELRSVNKVYLSDMVDKGNEIYKLQQELTELKAKYEEEEKISSDLLKDSITEIDRLRNELADLKKPVVSEGTKGGKT